MTFPHPPAPALAALDDLTRSHPAFATILERAGPLPWRSRMEATVFIARQICWMFRTVRIFCLTSRVDRIAEMPLPYPAATWPRSPLSRTTSRSRIAAPRCWSA